MFYDLFEPIAWMGVGCGLCVFGLTFGTGISAIASVGVVCGILGVWRIRHLAVAKKLKESVKDLMEENDRLEEEVNQLCEIVGIVGVKVEDLEIVKSQLIELYKKYKKENEKHTNNNLLDLFQLTDLDSNMILSPPELKRIEEYIYVVYNVKMDIQEPVTLQEFIGKFKELN